MVSEEELVMEGGEIELELAQPCCSIDTDKAMQLSPVCKLPALSETKHMCALHIIGARHAARLTCVSE